MRDGEPTARSILETSGYLVLPAVFSRAEVVAMREAVQSTAGASSRFRPAEGGLRAYRGLHAAPGLGRALLSDRLMAAMAAMVETETVVVTGECDVNVDVASDWHKDVNESWNLGASVFGDRWKVYKAAVYLQDLSPAEALQIRPGSHRSRTKGRRAAVMLPVAAGDVVLFDVRIDHRGAPRDLADRLLHRACRAAARLSGTDGERLFTGVRARLRGRLGREPRIGVFLTFGPQAPETEVYERAGRAVHGPVPAPLEPALVARLAMRGMTLIGGAAGPQALSADTIAST